MQQAESDVERQSVIDWWDLTMSTRGVSRQARRVIVMQRLHHQDLSGHVLEQGDWVHICLPMRYEVGRDRPISFSIAKPSAHKELSSKTENGAGTALGVEIDERSDTDVTMVGSGIEPTMATSPRQQQTDEHSSKAKWPDKSHAIHASTHENINKTNYLETSSFQDNLAQASVDDKSINISDSPKNPSLQENAAQASVDGSGAVSHPDRNICGGEEVGVPVLTNSTNFSESDFENEKHSLNKEVESEKISNKN